MSTSARKQACGLPASSDFFAEHLLPTLSLGTRALLSHPAAAASWTHSSVALAFSTFLHPESLKVSDWTADCWPSDPPADYKSKVLFWVFVFFLSFPWDETQMHVGYRPKYTQERANPICVKGQPNTVVKTQAVETRCLGFNAASYSLISSVNLGKPLLSQSFSFAICKMGVMIVPT